MDPRLKHPFTCMLSGPSGCGKSTLIQQILGHRDILIDPPVERVVWYYSTWQPLYDTILDVEFVEGLPDLNSLDKKTRNLIVIDDLMEETDGNVAKIFTKFSHHCNTSCFYLVQALFNKNKQHRVISLNCHYMILFKNPRDRSEIVNLGKQMYPGHTKFMHSVFEDATCKPHGYLFVDLKQETPEHLRLRTEIVPGQTQYVYLRRA